MAIIRLSFEKPKQEKPNSGACYRTANTDASSTRRGDSRLMGVRASR